MTPIEIDIARMVPRFLINDKNGYALAKAIEVCMQRVVDIVLAGVREVLDVSHMSEWRLDEMAWEWNVTWYDYDADVETKRRSIAGMRDVFGSAGTPSALRAVIEQYFGDGAVEEWASYDGPPFHFRISTANPKATNESARQLAVMVELVKNARSVYDGAVIEKLMTLNLRSVQRALFAPVIQFKEGTS